MWWTNTHKTTQAKNCRLRVVVWKIVLKNCSFRTLSKSSHILQSIRYVHWHTFVLWWQVMLDVFWKGSLKVNGVCISELRQDNSSFVVNEAMMQTAERSKEPKTKAPHHPPEMSPFLVSREAWHLHAHDQGLLSRTRKGPAHLAFQKPWSPWNKPFSPETWLKDSSESSNVPAAFRVKGRKRL